MNIMAKKRKNLMGNNKRYEIEDSEVRTSSTPVGAWMAEVIYNSYEKGEDAPILEEIGGYGKTYVKGESELLTRLMGLEPRYTYENTFEFNDDAFKSENMNINEPDDKLYKHNSYDSMQTYSPEESPIIEIEPNVFEVNPNTDAGRILQDRIDYSYSRALHTNSYEKTLPDEYWKEGRDEMLFGEEPLLGKIFFEDDGSFRDLWNLDLDNYEVLLSKENIKRTLGSSIFTENRPVIRGKARDRRVFNQDEKIINSMSRGK